MRKNKKAEGLMAQLKHMSRQYGVVTRHFDHLGTQD